MRKLVSFTAIAVLAFALLLAACDSPTGSTGGEGPFGAVFCVVIN
jgi:ABC-type oligopeptide transport system substrate-binding subunit